MLEKVLGCKITIRGNQSATKVLIKWVGQETKEATWEFMDNFNNKFPNFERGDKLNAYGGG